MPTTTSHLYARPPQKAEGPFSAQLRSPTTEKTNRFIGLVAYCGPSRVAFALSSSILEVRVVPLIFSSSFILFQQQIWWKKLKLYLRFSSARMRHGERTAAIAHKSTQTCISLIEIVFGYVCGVCGRREEVKTSTYFIRCCTFARCVNHRPVFGAQSIDSRKTKLN